jgi:hypothetical protein
MENGFIEHRHSYSKNKNYFSALLFIIKYIFKKLKFLPISAYVQMFINGKWNGTFPY